MSRSSSGPKKINVSSGAVRVYSTLAATATIEKQVFAELCDLVDETIELYIQDGKPLPEPTCGRDYANKMLQIV